VFRQAPVLGRPFESPLAADLVRPGEEIIAGRRPVEEALTARRTVRRLLVVPHRRASLETLVLRATHEHVAVVEVEGGTLTSLAGFDGHQGIALVVDARRWASLDEVLARAAVRGEAAFVLVLDSLEDPQNLGALLRSAEACGIHGVVFPTRHAAPLTPSAVKTSAGAVEHLLLVPVDDLAGALADLRTHGLRIVGADEAAPLSYRDADLRGPLALVVGSEGRGIGAAVHRRLDLEVRIPMRGRIGSLNAAVAGSVLLFEALAQRDTDVPDQAAALGQGRDAVDEPGRRGMEPAASPGGLSTEAARPTGAAGPVDAPGPVASGGEPPDELLPE
jgi:23S rRNA (guanosine2251-2'-O)-methyltransferase